MVSHHLICFNYEPAFLKVKDLPQIPDGETHGFEGILPGRPISGKKAAQLDHEGL